MKNRQAVYYDSIVPPRPWIVTTALLWDKIWIGPFGMIFDVKWDSKRFPGVETPNFMFVREILKRSDIIDRNPTPHTHFDGIVSPVGDTAEEYIATYTKLFEDFLAKCPVIFPDRYKALDEENTDSDNLVDVISILRKRFIPPWLIPGYPDFDFFHESLDLIKNIRANQIVHSIQATIPIDNASLSLNKIIEFREEKLLQRRTFQDAVDELLDQFDQCSSAEQLEKTTKHIISFVNDRLNELDSVYRKYRIDTVKKILSVSFSAPAISSVLTSLLSVPFYTPAGIASALALLSADILNERSKAISEIQKSSWAYLWNLRKMKG